MVVALLMHVGDETAIDLDLVEREGAQVIERGVAGTEIVQGDLHAQLPDSVQHRQRFLALLHQQVLGDLELQPVRCNAGRGQRIDDVVEQIAVAHLGGRQVDRDEQFFRPVRRFGQRFAKDPRSDGHDLIGLLGDGDEDVGRDHPAFRMVPPQKRFVARRHPRACIQQRLEMHFELSAGQSRTQVQFQRAALLHPLLHRGIEHGSAPSAVRLGIVKREIGGL